LPASAGTEAMGEELPDTRPKSSVSASPMGHGPFFVSLGSQARKNIETSISKRPVNFLGCVAHDVNHVSLDLWTIGVIGFPVVEPILVGAFELFRTKAGSDDRKRMCFVVG